MQRDEFSDRDWIELVKHTREKFGDSLPEAFERLFADTEVRRLVALRVNRSAECRKQALSNIRREGDQSYFVMVDDKIYFRDSAPK